MFSFIRIFHFDFQLKKNEIKGQDDKNFFFLQNDSKIIIKNYNFCIHFLSYP